MSVLIREVQGFNPGYGHLCAAEADGRYTAHRRPDRRVVVGHIEAYRVISIPPMMVSPAPPSTISSPAPALMLSAPAPPEMLSSPAPP